MGYNLTPIVKNLLLLNIAIFAVQALVNIDLPEFLGLRYIFADEFRPYQLPAHIFVHAGFWHLFSNMFALFIFGPMLERVMGSDRFLIFYLICGYGASLLYGTINFVEISQMQVAMEEFVMAPSPDELHRFILNYTPGYQYYQPTLYDFVNIDYAGAPTNPNNIASAKQLIREVYTQASNVPMVGASGAIFGVLFGFAFLFPNVELMLLFPPIPIKAKYLVTVYAGYELYSIIQARPDDNVAHFAHVGGMIFAYVLLKIWNTQRPTY